jgi:hypothetical protein
MYEATVGAGLPVMSTLKNLLDTGDRVVSIEGILSGTLSYLFNSYRPGDAFSGVVAQAKALGYTEPDPRDDLSGGPGWVGVGWWVGLRGRLQILRLWHPTHSQLLLGATCGRASTPA